MVIVSTLTNPRRAFALIDVVVAGVILAVGLGVVISLSGRAVRSAQQGEELATAAMLADEQLNLVLSRGPDDYAKRFAVEGACDDPFSQYRYRLDFAGGRSVSEPYEVSVTVSWGGGGAVPRNAPPSSTSADDSRVLTIKALMAPHQIGADVDTDPDRRPATTIQRGAR